MLCGEAVASLGDSECDGEGERAAGTAYCDADFALDAASSAAAVAPRIADLVVQLFAVCRATLPASAFSCSYACSDGGADDDASQRGPRLRSTPMGVVCGVDVHAFLAVRCGRLCVVAVPNRFRAMSLFSFLLLTSVRLTTVP
jgi:hypothetical protein